MGIYQSYFDKQQQSNDERDIKKLETQPHMLEEGKRVEFHLKRLIHESVGSIEELLPYLHTRLYKKDNPVVNNDNVDNNTFGWFPMEWIYAEVDIEGDLEADFQHLYENYQFRYSKDQNNETLDNTTQQENEEDINNNKYNPFYMLRYPRIPLFVIEIKLPIGILQNFADNIETQSPNELITTYNLRSSIVDTQNNDSSNNNNIDGEYHHEHCDNNTQSATFNHNSQDYINSSVNIGIGRKGRESHTKSSQTQFLNSTTENPQNEINDDSEYPLHHKENEVIHIKRNYQHNPNYAQIDNDNIDENENDDNNNDNNNYNHNYHENNFNQKEHNTINSQSPSSDSYDFQSNNHNNKNHDHHDDTNQQYYS